jgi:hypothetical protein
MTKLSISFAAATLSVSLPLAVNAYGTEPAPLSYATLSQVEMSPAVASDHDGTCAVPMTALQAFILGFRMPDWMTRHPSNTHRWPVRKSNHAGSCAFCVTRGLCRHAKPI